MKFALALFFLSAATFANSYAPCPEAIRKLVYYHQRGSLGLDSYKEKANPVETAFKDFSKTHPGNSWSPGAIADWKEEFYQDVLLFLTHTTPDPDSWNYFQSKYGLSKLEAQDILTYYASRHYFAVLPELGPVRETLGRLSTVSREHRLGEPKDELSRRYPYYLFNLTQKSVPEIAAELSITENKVYQELSALGLSIEAEFNRPLSAYARNNLDSHGYKDIPLDSVLEAAKSLLKNKVPTPQIADLLGIGKEALDFVLHYDHTKNRGVKWDRKTKFKKILVGEKAFLEHLWKKDRPSARIAKALNKLFKTKPGDENYRTQASVSAQARLLGLTNPKASGPDVSHPVYGDLKLQGDLVPENVIPFIYDHYDRSLKELAKLLAVTPSALNAFLKRHDLTLLPAASRTIAPPLSDDQLKRFTADDGMLALLFQNLNAMSAKTEKTLLDFASSQITDKKLATDIRSKIQALGIFAHNGSHARNGQKTAAYRIHEALMLILEGKTGRRPLEMPSASAAAPLFNLEPLKSLALPPQLSDSQLQRFTADNGMLALLFQNLTAMSRKAELTLLNFASSQIEDEKLAADIRSKIQALGISGADGGSARQGQKTPAYRIHEALMLILEAKTGQRPSEMPSAAEGSVLFNLEPLKVFTQPPIISDSQLQRFTADDGMLALLFQNLVGMNHKADQTLLDFASSQISNKNLAADIQSKVQTLGISTRDGHNARIGGKSPAYRIHEALMLILEAKTGRRPSEMPSAAEGSVLFNLDPLKVFIKPPVLSDSDLRRFTSDDGMLALLFQNLNGMSKKTEQTLLDFASSQISDKKLAPNIRTKIQALGISPRDGDSARGGIKTPANRIHEALMLILEAENGTRPPEPLLSAEDGRKWFGLK